VPAFSWLISIRSWVGLAGPLFGIAADRFGQKRLMQLGMLAQVVGLISLLFLSGWGALVSMVLLGVASSALVPAQQAFISDQVPYERRGRAIALVDMSFATAGVLAMPIFGLLLERWGWRMPIGVLTALSVFGLLLLWRVLPASSQPARAMVDRLRLAQVPAMLARPNVIASILSMVLLFFAFGSFVTIWSIWLHDAFKLDAVAIGLVATLTGLAELAGVLLSAMFIDRVGKRRGVLTALGLATLMIGLWMAVQGDFETSRAVIVILGALLELSIVSLFPLLAEQLPESRAMLFSLAGLGASCGLALGSPVAVALWQWHGLTAVGVTCIVALLAVVVLVWRNLHSGPPGH